MRARSLAHIEWLDLVDITGPFLADTVLKTVFPQGLDRVEKSLRGHLYSIYEEWRDAFNPRDDHPTEIHRRWIRAILEEALGFDAHVMSPEDLPTYYAELQDKSYTPDLLVRSSDDSDLLYIHAYPPSIQLDQPLERDWITSPIERMTLLCRAQRVRLGLVTNGERWVLINTPLDASPGHTSWYAQQWWREPMTFQAFISLLGRRRRYGPSEDRLDRILDRSLKDYHEITDTLGEQVYLALEALVQSLGHANNNHHKNILKSVPPEELYNAGLTVMLRLMFLSCAEARGLLFAGDPVYDQNYAISTLQAQLQDDAQKCGEDHLKHQHDAWPRLLSSFRAIYCGVEHESSTLSAMGSSIFDPDRFTFLEGRAENTQWRDTPIVPLPIDNRTVLLLLRSLQVFNESGEVGLGGGIGHLEATRLEDRLRRRHHRRAPLLGELEALVDLRRTCTVHVPRA